VAIKLSLSPFPWKGLLKHFAEKGYVLWNYPEDVTFPCDDTRGKGIQGVSASEQKALLDAFTHPTHPLRLVHEYPTGGTYFS
jgi:hypothetical protein